MPPDEFYERDDALTRRNEIYLLILTRGLLRIRGLAWSGDPKACEIEADHLHNIPAYVAGGDDAPHLYYLTTEVPSYLATLHRETPGTAENGRYCVELWRELEGLVPIDGSPWADRWREMKANGWDYQL